MWRKGLTWTLTVINSNRTVWTLLQSTASRSDISLHWPLPWSPAFSSNDVIPYTLSTSFPSLVNHIQRKQHNLKFYRRKFSFLSFMHIKRFSHQISDHLSSISVEQLESLFVVLLLLQSTWKPAQMPYSSTRPDWAYLLVLQCYFKIIWTESRSTSLHWWECTFNGKASRRAWVVVALDSRNKARVVC